MQEQDSNSSTLTIIAFGIALIGVGVWAILQPDLLADYDPSARKSLFKNVVKWAWGTTGGIVSIIAGVAVSALAFFPAEDDDPQK